MIESETLIKMMKEKEKIMEIVMKAIYYGVKFKANRVLFDKLLGKNFVTGVKTYRFLFMMMNHNLSTNDPDNEAMKNTMAAVDYYFCKFQDEVPIDKCAHFVKVQIKVLPVDVTFCSVFIRSGYCRRRTHY